MICPACREEMIVVEYKKIELDICVACRGVWFDADELGLLLGSLDLSADGIGRPLEEKPSEEPRKCPYCRGKMDKILMGTDEAVVIDKCKKGHGLWFDGGELDTVIAGLKKASTDAGAEVGSFLGDVLLAGDDTVENGE
ncbi:MAG: zf-TFIIB domain-containing protein [Planctomycetota bacterium]